MELTPPVQLCRTYGQAVAVEDHGFTPLMQVEALEMQVGSGFGGVVMKKEGMVGVVSDDRVPQGRPENSFR